MTSHAIFTGTRFGLRLPNQTSGRRSSRIQDYRAYLIGSDGLFYKSIALDAPDEAVAIEAAKQLVDGHDVELWQRDRKIGKFEHKK